jgi:hypothetical protein
MTTAADDAAVEDAFEACLAGRPVPEQAADTFPGVAAFTEAVRATATQPGKPNAALAELLVTGLLTDQSSPSARTARSAGSPPARRPAPVRIRRRTAMIFPVLLAKFLSAGAIAQAATGAGVAVVVVTGVGAAGALPDPLQDTVSSVVQTVTPFEIAEGEEPTPEEPAVSLPVNGEPAGEESEESVDGEGDGETDGETDGEVPAEDAEFDIETWDAEGPDAYPSFGAWVRVGAGQAAFKEEGINFGQIVSKHARAKHMDDDELAAEGVVLDELTAEPETGTDPETEVQPEPEVSEEQVATAERGNRGNGNGSGNGGAKADGKGAAKADGNGNGKSNGGGRGGDR